MAENINTLEFSTSGTFCRTFLVLNKSPWDVFEFWVLRELVSLCLRPCGFQSCHQFPVCLHWSMGNPNETVKQAGQAKRFIFFFSSSGLLSIIRCIVMRQCCCVIRSFTFKNLLKTFSCFSSIRFLCYPPYPCSYTLMQIMLSFSGDLKGLLIVLRKQWIQLFNMWDYILL